MSENLESVANFYGVNIVEFDFPSAIRGVYHDGVIGVNKNIQDHDERRCIIACNVGRHLMRNNMEITLSEEVENTCAMYWAVLYLMPLESLCDKEKFGVIPDEEFAKQLNVTPQFFQSGLAMYKTTIGKRVFFDDCIIDFENKKIEKQKKVG